MRIAVGAPFCVELISFAGSSFDLPNPFGKNMPGRAPFEGDVKCKSPC